MNHLKTLSHGTTVHDFRHPETHRHVLRIDDCGRRVAQRQIDAFRQAGAGRGAIFDEQLEQLLHGRSRARR